MLKMVKDISQMVNIHYIRQKEALGLGHAVLQAKAFVQDEPFAVLLGDDVVVNHEGKPALQQLIHAYDDKQASVLGVQTISINDVDKNREFEYGMQFKQPVHINFWC